MNAHRFSLHSPFATPCRWVTASLRVVLGLLAATLSFVACDDDLATGIDIQPAFSTDTLNIGTLLTEASSQTYQLMIYNRHSDEIRLSAIVLREGSESGFRMNVDGMNGTEFTHADLLRIAAHDSMFVFIEATFPATGLATLTQHTAHIDVTCNGATQTVVLTATSRDTWRVSGLVITSDTTFRRASEVQILDSLVVAAGATLTLEDSVTLYLHDKAELIVYGRLRAEGTQTAPVHIRGDRMDRMFDNLPYDNLPGQWGALRIKSSSRGNLLCHADVRGMTDGIRVEPADIDTLGLREPRLTVRSCRIHNSAGPLIFAESADMRIENSELSNAAGSLLELYGGAHDIIHCTLANYHFAAAIDNYPVYFANLDTIHGIVYDLYRCNFINTLIWSRLSGKDHTDVWYDFWPIENPDGEFYSSKYGVRYDSIFHYRFDHCLIHADGYDDDDFIKTVWNEDPLFRLIDASNYSYDFHLGEGSPAIGAGAAEGVDNCPTDLDGVARTLGVAPSIGCYEYVAGSPAPSLP